MPHTCELKVEHVSVAGETFSSKIKRKVQALVVIDESNPLSLRYFRSAVTVRKEKERQLKLNHWFVIHPSSKFRKIYDIYLFSLLFVLLIQKPLECCFSRIQDVLKAPIYSIVTGLLDILCWIDIFINFVTGYPKDRVRTIELRLSKIAWRYIKSPYFTIDVLSSFPRNIWIYIAENPIDLHITIGLINILMMLKVLKLPYLIELIGKLAVYFRVKSRGTVFMTNCALVCLLMVHWMACFQFGVSRIVRVYLRDQIDRRSWIYQNKIDKLNYVSKYSRCLLKSTAYMLGVRLEFYGINLPEEYIVAILTYLLGKILIASIWVILAITILNSRSVDIKYQEIINQLNEYMKQKMLPIELRLKINDYYRFKYQNKYFKETLISNFMSDSLRTEVDVHVSKSLISNVTLFSELNLEEIQKVVSLLIPEIFLPNERIIVSGDFGDAMYFLSSGTVAVYTHSGKEVCHLQDGAYFGEISLVIKGQSRVATVIAIETSIVYRLDRKSFEKSLMKNREVYLKLSQEAEERMRETTKLEEGYKKVLFEQIYQ